MFSVSRPAISRHLRVLRRAGLVVEHRRGRQRIYRLNPTPLREVEEWLTAFRLHTAARLMDLKDIIEAGAESEKRA